MDAARTERKKNRRYEVSFSLLLNIVNSCLSIELLLVMKSEYGDVQYNDWTVTMLPKIKIALKEGYDYCLLLHYYYSFLKQFWL